MKELLTQLRRAQPVLRWTLGELEIAAGTSWVTFTVNNCHPIRFSDTDSLKTCKDSLAWLFTRSAGTINLGPNLVVSILRRPVSSRISVYAWEEDPVVSENLMIESIFRDLLSWLVLVIGEPAYPLGSNYHGASLIGNRLTLNLDTPVEMTVDSPSALAAHLLNTISGSVKDVPLATVNQGTPVTCHRTINGLRLTYSGAGLGPELTYTAMAHLATVLQTTVHETPAHTEETLS